MSENAWDQLEEESTMWYDRFLQFLNLGSDRSLLATFHAYEKSKGRNKASKTPPASWRDACANFRWRERADAYDKQMIARRQAAIEADQDEVYSTGKGLIHERVRSLKKLADLYERILDQELVDEVINPRKHEVYIQYLDAIAEQKGDKKLKQEITGANGGPIEQKVIFYMPEQIEEYTDDEEEVHDHGY